MRPPIEERLAEAGLQPLPRTAWLEIDLDAVRSNLSLLRSVAGPGVPIRPVVKADAYGHGAAQIARMLSDAGVDGFCVAALDEALALRAAGIDDPILVMYPVPAGWAGRLAAARIAVTAGDVGLLDALLAERVSASVPAEPDLRIELEVETGLGRGGFSGDALVTAAQAIEAGSGVSLAGLWTHLQAPDDAEWTGRQYARFDAAAEALRAASVGLPPRHATASTGLVSEGIVVEEVAYDGVRPGLALYGLIPDELGPTQRSRQTATALRPALSLHARPVRVADLPADWGVSYGPTFTTSRPSRIATLPLGYGDGWSRALSNRADALVRGGRVPLVGNVAMDAVMADVTDVPGPPVTTDDEFTLIGAQGPERITVGDLARTRTTNSWEVVVSMAARLPRVYHAASGPVGLRTLTERS